MVAHRAEEAAPAGDRRHSILPRTTRLPRAWLVVAFLLPLILLGAWGAWLAGRTADDGTAARVGHPAPAFALADLDGNPVRLADLRGRPVLLNFWASWCGPCLDEFPLLTAAAERSDAADLAIVGVVYHDNSEAARTFMRRMGADWATAMDPGDAVAQAYGIYGPPETFFIDRDGILAGRQVGQLTGSDLDRQLALILPKE